MTVDEWFTWFEQVTSKSYDALSNNGVMALNVAFKRTKAGWFDIRLFKQLPAVLERSGFNFVDVAIYGKPNPAPNGSMKRADSPAWEPVYIVTKAADINHYHYEPYRQPYKPKSTNGDGTLNTRSSGILPHPKGSRQTNLMIHSCSGDQNRPKAKGQSYPLELVRRLILQYSNPGDLVLDPFVGVGTTCRAAQLTGRLWLGIEINEKEATKARKWLNRPYTLPMPLATAV